MKTLKEMDPNTGRPFKNRKEQEIWLDLEHFIKTGRRRRKQLNIAA